jgi:hypothetical protein
MMSVLSHKICLYVEIEAMRDRVDLSIRTDSRFFTKETLINKLPSHTFTVAALLLHGSEECY